MTLPKNWILAKLGEVCKVNMGQSPDSDTYNTEKKGLPFFQGNADFTELYPIPRKWCSNPIKIAEANDVLLSVRAPVGAINLANQTCCIGRGLSALTYANYKFLFYFLQTIKRDLEDKATGTTFTAISGEIIRETLIPLPPLAEQARIVAKLEALLAELDQATQSLHQLQAQCKLYRQSVLQAAFDGKFTGGTKGWEMVKLGEVLSFIGSGATPKGGENVYSKSGILFIRSQNVYPNKLILDDVAYIDKDIDEKMKRSRVYPNDVLLNITGASIGRCTHVPNNFFAANVNQHVCILRASQNILNCEYLSFYINSIQAQSNINRIQLGATRQALNYEQIRNFKIPFCPIEIQIKTLAAIKKRFLNIEQVETSVEWALQQAKVLRQSILQQAFEGKLVEQREEESPIDLAHIKEALQAQAEAEKKAKQNRPKTIKNMAEELKNIIPLLQKAQTRITPRELWCKSVYKEDIETFYAELKELEEKGEIEQIQEGRNSFIQLKKQSTNDANR